MKTFRILGMVVVVVLMCVCYGCNGAGEEIPEITPVIPTPEKPAPEEQPVTYTVKMNLGDEYVDISEEPLSRANATASKKYYAVNVLCMKTDGTENQYSHYSSGVFDTKENMTVTLLGGYKYKFECTSLTEMEDKVYIYNNYLCSPLNIDVSKLNQFEANNYCWSISEGTIETHRYTYKEYPRADRYYGELTDYTPQSNGAVTIPMKKTVFGLKWNIKAIPDGTLSWQVYSNSSGHLTTNNGSHTGSESLEFTNIYTFEEVYESWKNDNYTKQFTIYFTWTRANGYQQTFEQEVTVKRNVMTTINVNLKGGSKEISLGLQEETTEMSSESVDIDYDGGDMTDTEVTPDETTD